MRPLRRSRPPWRLRVSRATRRSSPTACSRAKPLVASGKARDPARQALRPPADDEPQDERQEGQQGRGCGEDHRPGDGLLEGGQDDEAGRVRLGAEVREFPLLVGHGPPASRGRCASRRWPCRCRPSPPSSRSRGRSAPAGGSCRGAPGRAGRRHRRSAAAPGGRDLPGRATAARRRAHGPRGARRRSTRRARRLPSRCRSATRFRGRR